MPGDTDAKALPEAIVTAETYLKHYFGLHLELDADIAAHCIFHGLRTLPVAQIT